MSEDQCEIKRCRNLSMMQYPVNKNGKRIRVCDKHWDLHCDDSKRFKISKENAR